MKVYVVFKTGVYRHECGGVFLTIELAEQAARQLIEGERDDYHGYEVVPFDINEKTNQVPLLEGVKYSPSGELQEQDIVFTLSRTKGLITKHER